MLILLIQIMLMKRHIKFGRLAHTNQLVSDPYLGIVQAIGNLQGWDEKKGSPAPLSVMFRYTQDSAP